MNNVRIQIRCISARRCTIRHLSLLLIVVGIFYAVDLKAEKPMEPQVKMLRAKILKQLEQIAGSIVVEEDGQIASIEFKGKQVNDDHLKWLAEYGNVKLVKLVDTNVTVNGLTTLSGITSITELYLEGTWVTNDKCRTLRVMSQLTCLEIRDANIDDNALEYFAPLDRLSSLRLDGCAELEGEGLRYLTCGATLEWLFLEGSGIQGNALRHLSRMNLLEMLWLKGTKIDNASLEYLQGEFAHLNTLALSDTQIGDAGLAHLTEGFDQLQTLLMSNTAVTDVGLSHLSKLKELTYLRLDGSHVRGPGLRHLVELPKLKTLDLANLPITEKDVVPLARMASLEELFLGDMWFTDPQLVRFLLGIPEEQLPNLKTLRTLGAKYRYDKELSTYLLDISNPLFNDSHVKLLPWCLGRCHYVRLAGIGLTDEGIVELCTIRPVEFLTKLDLIDTQVTENAIRLLKEQVPGVDVVR